LRQIILKHYANVWSAALLQAKVKDDRMVCANVFVNKGEDVVKCEDILPLL